jgi:hypothetical protein
MPESIRQGKTYKSLLSALLVEAEMAKGRPPNEGESETIKLTMPKPLHSYLVYLARNTYAGASVSEVVNHLLKDKLEELGAELVVPKETPK